MATVEQKIRCEHRVRELIRARGLPEPDHVEYGFTCVRIMWRGARVAMCVDIDDERDPAPVELVDELHASQPPLGDDAELFGDGYDPLELIEEVPSPN